jgi:CDP-6-deoxy-D-xylo-4-hexulose-3-dehydrase
MQYNLTSFEFGDEDFKRLEDIFSSGKLTMGCVTRKFEEELAKFHDRKYAVMVNSGSSANLLMISVLVNSGRLAKGDKVLVPAVSWSTTFFPITQLGLVPVFCDVDLSTFCLSEKVVADAINAEKISAVLNVSLLGYFAHSKKIEQLCCKNNIIYIEDCCESFGSISGDAKAGSLGEIATLSFFYSHQLPAIEGGCLLTDDDELYDYALSMRAHGWTRDIESDKYLQIESDPFKRSFRFVLPGYCLRPIEFTASLGLSSLDRWKNASKIRTSNLKSFHKYFQEGNYHVQATHDGMSAFGFGFIMNSEEDRSRAVSLLQANGVQVRPIVAGNFLRNPVIQRMEHLTFGEFKNSDKIDDCGLFIGNHAEVLDEKIRITSSLLTNV